MTESPVEIEDPLKRIPGETHKSYKAFRDYALMGIGRNLRDLIARYRAQDEAQDDERDAKPPTASWGTLSGWSSRYRWVERAQIFDDHVQAQDARDWEARRREVRERGYKIALQLHDLTEGVLEAAPNFYRSSVTTTDPGQPAVVRVVVDESGRELRREVVAQGTPQRTVQTVALDARTAVQSFQTAQKIARLAAEMDTERKDIRVHHDTIAIDFVLNENEDAPDP